MSSTIDRAAEHVGRGLAGLESVSGDVRAAKQLLALLGWDLPPGVTDIGLAQLDVSTVVTRLEDLTALRAEPTTSDVDVAVAVAEVVAALADTFSHVDSLVASFQATPQYLSATDIAGQFFGRLLDTVVIGAMGTVVPAAVSAGTLLGSVRIHGHARRPGDLPGRACPSEDPVGPAFHTVYRSRGVAA